MRSGEGCAPGATRELVCSAACVFEPAGACEAPDTCTNPGAIERVPCGSMCGSQERFCTAARLWEYGTCEEAGECVPGTIDAVPCTRCGMQQRRCTAECAWELFGTCTDQGACSPGETTWSDVGCGPQQIRELTCDATCAYDAGPCVGAPTDLLDGLGGPTGYGEGTLALSDDGASEPIDLGAAFPSGVLVYGTTYTSVYVNNNGSISFGGAITSYTPTPFPVTERPMIAPFWGDVDTRSGMRPGTNDVHWDVDSGRFVATWHRVGYFNRHTDRLNSFQVILTDRSDVAPGAFDVEFRYAQCEWTTGDATGGSGGLGGTPAQAGFDAGNGIDSVALPGSGTSAVLDLCTTTNAGTLGLWRFQVRDGIPN